MKKYLIYVDDQVVYEGNFDEVPEHYRVNLLECLDEWSDVLGKSSINELIYSSLYWYNEENMYCGNCSNFFQDQTECADCKLELQNRYVYERNPAIDKILDCIGMITSIETIK